VHLIIFDVVPALLTWDHPADIPEPVPSAAEVLDRLYPNFRMIAVTGGGRTARILRRHLEDTGLAEFFDGVATNSAYGPELSPRVALRIARTAGAGLGQAAVVTGREDAATTLRKAGLPVVFVSGAEGLEMLPEALDSLRSGRFSP
jgi:phosphoglycolate phosphatase-like HAD superfamily hydrolase